MPRQARLDAFRTSSGIFDRLLHHVIVRGLERRGIFQDDVDRADFVARLAQRAEQQTLTVLACESGAKSDKLQGRGAAGRLTACPDASSA